jgi:site-specific DNA recombinase
MQTDRAAEQRNRRSLERMIADRKLQVDRVVDAIAEGTDSPGLRGKLVKLEGELAELSLRREDEAAIVNLAPDLPSFYRKQVEARTELVKAPELVPRAAAVLRDLVDRLVLRPTEAWGEFELELQGHLAGLIRFAAGKPAGRSALVLERGYCWRREGPPEYYKWTFLGVSGFLT